MKRFLLVVDLQRGFLSNGSTRRAAERIDRLCQIGEFDRVFASRYRNYDGSPIDRLMGWHKLKKPEEQALAVGAAGAKVFEKTVYSAAAPAFFAMMREENGGELPKAVFLAGVDTECCVLATAAGLFEAGVRPVVLADYCASSGGERQHTAGIAALRSMIGENNIHHGEIRSARDLDEAVQNAETLLFNSQTREETALRVLRGLRERRLTITFAESCTGGLAAARLVGLPSASEVFCESFVTYANEAKTARLGVAPQTIAAHGVVSEEVAREMARGAAKVTGAGVGVGITGIAGPTGGVPGKPVGTVCFGFSLSGELFSRTVHFGDIGRETVREKSVDFVFDVLADILGNKKTNYL